MKATYETFLPLFKGTYGNFWEEDNFYELFEEDIKNYLRNNNNYYKVKKKVIKTI